jgi:hypothetical protein
VRWRGTHKRIATHARLDLGSCDGSCWHWIWGGRVGTALRLWLPPVLQGRHHHAGFYLKPMHAPCRDQQTDVVEVTTCTPSWSRLHRGTGGRVLADLCAPLILGPPQKLLTIGQQLRAVGASHRLRRPCISLTSHLVP